MLLPAPAPPPPRQSPACQAAYTAGLPRSIPCSSVNKSCASGLKAVSLASSSITAGLNDVVVAGGMENMSSAAHYLSKSRSGTRLGNFEVVDSIFRDGA